MKVIMMDAEEFKQIMDKINRIQKSIEDNKTQTPLTDKWLDVQEVCELLKISKRTLQNYRDQGIISYSQISGKIYFRATDIEEHLNKHYTNSKH